MSGGPLDESVRLATSAVESVSSDPRRAIRFARSLALGSLLVCAPVSGCSSSTPPDEDGGMSSVDAGTGSGDAGMGGSQDAGRDSSFPIDGPLHPPDLPRDRRV